MTAERLVIAAYEPCGCMAAVHVLDEHAVSAYEMAAQEAKRGCRIETVEIETWRARPWYCPEHPKGPPWWVSNGGKGKAPQPSLGL